MFACLLTILLIFVSACDGGDQCSSNSDCSDNESDTYCCFIVRFGCCSKTTHESDQKKISEQITEESTTVIDRYYTWLGTLSLYAKNSDRRWIVATAGCAICVILVPVLCCLLDLCFVIRCRKRKSVMLTLPRMYTRKGAPLQNTTTATDGGISHVLPSIPEERASDLYSNCGSPCRPKNVHEEYDVNTQHVNNNYSCMPHAALKAEKVDYLEVEMLPCTSSTTAAHSDTMCLSNHRPGRGKLC